MAVGFSGDSMQPPSRTVHLAALCVKREGSRKKKESKAERARTVKFFMSVLSCEVTGAKMGSQRTKGQVG